MMSPIGLPPLPDSGAHLERAKLEVQKAGSNETPEDKQIREAALQFEGILVRQLLEPLEKSLEKGMGTNSSSPMVGGMIINGLGQSIIDGGGLGLAAVIEESLRQSVAEPVSLAADKARPVLPGGGETD